MRFLTPQPGESFLGKISAPTGLVLTLLCLFSFQSIHAQNRIKGKVEQKSSGQPLVGASVLISGTQRGALTQGDGSFTIIYPGDFPITIEATFFGYDTVKIEVASASQELVFGLSQADYGIAQVEITASAAAERKKQSPLSIESMTLNAIKETPAANFYDGLGAMKEVDLNAASIGFKVINTRGFNSAAPVRSLQIIDGVDNQAPGLNFSLGNFLGASELDVELVDLIIGASSAYYGPNAFNGVISMKTKSPFVHKGLSFMAKGGERTLGEFAMRYARSFTNKSGRDIFAFKLNAYYLRADDWVADNYDPVDGTSLTPSNPGGYDAVNRYGEENVFDGTGLTDLVLNPGLGDFVRTGYNEEDIVNYDTRNLKLAAALHFMLTKKVELIASSSLGNGTTVLQGDNRYSLNNILFLQNRIELRQQGKFFFRAYSTNENAGDSYDAVFTAYRLQDDHKGDTEWITDYRNFWAGSANLAPGDSLRSIGARGYLRNVEGYPTPRLPFDEEQQADLQAFLNANSDIVQSLHNRARAYADSAGVGSRLIPGTPAYQAAFDDITQRPLSRGGTRLVDRSALYHLHGEWQFKPDWMDEIRVGANGRIYRPVSEGSIFEDTLSFVREEGPDGILRNVDSSFNPILNYEYGVYAGIRKLFNNDKLKFDATLRIDKNQNFNYVPSAAVSFVYSPNDRDIYRISFSAATRNPTLADQYLYYNVGPAILVGNRNGFNNLADTASYAEFLRQPFSSRDTSQIQYFNVAPIQPERVQTVEVGYRTSLFDDHLYLDASAYFSRYQDFIGYNLGLDLTFFSTTFIIPQAFRVAANATDIVTTAGASLGANYFVNDQISFNGNYSWNRLNSQSDDPIIPAYNTPEHKFNIGITGRDMEIGPWKNWGFAVNYKWIQGFFFEGSPQFTGNIPTYYMLDAQISQKVPKLNSTFKLGGANLLNNFTFQVYGGPRVGRLVYFSVLTELDKL
ncbi:MAG: carboxypeptidase-like regulatory domain-containing protein [Bacteroidia bacterium]|nr:carboxypeptidase-like regulatory domain-containing protein [Bacteroidia bacterium]